MLSFRPCSVTYIGAGSGGGGGGVGGGGGGGGGHGSFCHCMHRVSSNHVLQFSPLPWRHGDGHSMQSCNSALCPGVTVMVTPCSPAIQPFALASR